MSFLNQILEEAQKDRDPGRFPFSFGVEVTNHCNLRCPMCPREIAQRGYGNMSFELFTKLADQRFLRPFAWLDLPPGKFPQSGHRFALGTLGQQDPPVHIDQCTSRNKHNFCH